MVIDSNIKTSGMGRHSGARGGGGEGGLAHPRLTTNLKTKRFINNFRV